MRLLLRFWTQYAARHKHWYALGLVCLGATNVLAVAIPQFVQHAVDALGEGRGAESAVTWAWAVLLGGLGVIVVRTLSRTLFFNPGRAVEYEVKGALFDRLLVLPRWFHDRIKAGDLVSRGTNDTNSMRALIGYGSLQLFNVALTLVLTVGQMARTNPTLTLWCVGPLLVAALVMRSAVLRMFALVMQLQRQVGALSERILESYSGVSVLQSFNAVPGALARFDAENDRLLDISTRLLRIRSWLMPVVGVTGNGCVVLVLYVGGQQVMAGVMTTGEMAAFIVYINLLVAGLTSMSFLIGAVQRGYASLERIYEVLDAEEDRPAPGAPLPTPGTRGPKPPGGGLSFTHPTASEPALRDVSFTLRPGETLGVFGLTGSGKTTLLDLLARVYDPPPGTVHLSGADVLTLPVRDYRRDVAYVTQEPFLFSRTLRENIAVADLPDEVDPTRLDAAVKDAALDGDLENLPHGLETVVGERGITLSGGQRQRTALARAFYRDYEVLLLDDVMSAVDHATERRLVEAVHRRARGRSAVIVSHRISALKDADRILVLDAGRQVAEGRHAELLQRDGPYARAWKLQRAAEALEAADE